MKTFKNRIIDIICVFIIIVSIAVIYKTQTKPVALQYETSSADIMPTDTVQPMTKIIQYELLEKSCLVLDHSVMDFGTISKDTLLVANFIVTNVCDDTAFIFGVNPECTCTSYFVSKYKIPGNDTALIRITLDTHGKTGENKVHATLKDNSMEMQLLMLKVNVDN